MAARRLEQRPAEELPGDRGGAGRLREGLARRQRRRRRRGRRRGMVQPARSRAHGCTWPELESAAVCTAFDLQTTLWQAPRAALSPSCKGLCAYYSQVQQKSIETLKHFQKSTPGVHPRRRGRRRAWRARRRVAACWASCRRRCCTRWSRWLPRCAAPPRSAVRPPNVPVRDLCLLPMAG